MAKRYYDRAAEYEPKAYLPCQAGALKVLLKIAWNASWTDYIYGLLPEAPSLESISSQIANTLGKFTSKGSGPSDSSNGGGSASAGLPRGMPKLRLSWSSYFKSILSSYKWAWGYFQQFIMILFLLLSFLYYVRAFLAHFRQQPPRDLAQPPVNQPAPAQAPVIQRDQQGPIPGPAPQPNHARRDPRGDSNERSTVPTATSNNTSNNSNNFQRIIQPQNNATYGAVPRARIIGDMPSSSTASLQDDSSSMDLLQREFSNDHLSVRNTAASSETSSSAGPSSSSGASSLPRPYATLPSKIYLDEEPTTTNVSSVQERPMQQTIFHPSQLRTTETRQAPSASTSPTASLTYQAYIARMQKLKEEKEKENQQEKTD